MANQKELEIAIVFDGGSLGNPGKGYGSYRITTNGIDQPIRELQFGDNVTSNQAEYRTLIEALRDAIRLLEKNGYSPKRASVAVMTDSRLVVEQVAGRWKVKNRALQPLTAQAQQLLNQFGSWNVAWHSRDNSVRVLGH